MATATIALEVDADTARALAAASPEERRFVRDALRAHVAEHFPELQPP